MVVSTEYRMKTTPFAHQQEEWEYSKDLESRAIFWEQGTGKSKLVIDTAGSLYSLGKIDRMVVVAPSGVHRNWVVEELPKHLPDAIMERTRMFHFQDQKKHTKWHQAEVEALLKHKGFKVLAMSYDSVMTKLGKLVLWKFLNGGEALYVADESSRIKNPAAKRTIRMLASSHYARYRRILDGTPITNSPFDIYSPVKFVDEDFWKREARITSYPGFKTTFGVWIQQQDQHGRTFPQCVDFINMELLKELVDKISTRVTKDEVLDLPPKLYSKVHFELTNEQKRLYAQMRDEFMTYREKTGELITAPLAIVRMLRLRQIACGYLPSDDDNGPLTLIEGKNPRLEIFGEVAQDVPHQFIVWACYRQDINSIMEELAKRRITAVRYDGQVDEDGRGKALDLFKSGDAKAFVANPQAAGTGLTLTQAKTVMYYSNSFNLGHRLQSEDRAHRISQTESVNYIDFIAEGTIDKYIVDALKRKFDVATQITGDLVKEWL